MNFCSLHTPFSYSFTHLTLTSYLKPNKTHICFITAVKATSIPARDRVIDFGKHKGKMLGTLPSSYLKWVSKNLRARDFEQWAKLADTVLQDPVYQDRLEWEFTEKVLHGDFNISSSASRNNGGDGGDEAGVVSQLLEISERFGWDNEDKVGWSKIKLELLGTSKGGRIPRKAAYGDSKGGEIEIKREVKREIRSVSGVLCEGEERRRERRERVRLKREEKEEEESMKKKEKNNSILGDGAFINRNREAQDRSTVKIHNPFPGREALMKKVLNRKRIT